jgi:integrase/recombinase XerD
VLRIIGKGDKERLVPLPQPVLDDLGCLWRPHHNRRWLFRNRHGDAPINNRVLSRSFAAAAAVAGIRQRATPHALRHGYATRLVENGVNIRVVQILLGHAGIASTAIYTHLTTPTRASLHGLLDWLMTPRGGHDRARRRVPSLRGTSPQRTAFVQRTFCAGFAQQKLLIRFPRVGIDGRWGDPENVGMLSGYPDK